MPKYYIYDNDNQIGHLILKRQEPQSFEQSMPIGMVDNTPFILAASFGLSFGVFALIGWQEAGAIIGTLGGFGLAGIKAWRGSIIPESSDNTLRIEAEFTDPLAGVIYRDEIDNPHIDKEALVRLCEAIKNNNNEWIGRFKAQYLANVKRTQHTLIRTEFLRLNYLTENNKMQSRGKLFVRQVVGI